MNERAVMIELKNLVLDITRNPKKQVTAFLPFARKHISYSNKIAMGLITILNNVILSNVLAFERFSVSMK